MIESSNFLPDGLSLRPRVSADQEFLHNLYRTARPDLQLIGGEAEFRDHVVEQQYRALTIGATENYPNAIHFVIEKAATRIGCIVVDFGHNEARIIYLAFILEARGRGYGKEVLRGMQKAAHRTCCPLTVIVWRNNPFAKRLYLELGFRIDESQLTAERLIWYPRDLKSPQFLS